MKKFILCADGFGKNKDINRAVLNGYNSGFLKSTSIVANGEAYNAAINDILPECQKLSVGVHLNITDGKALTSCPLLTDEKGYFNQNFPKIQTCTQNTTLLGFIEQEFRAQIEKIQACTKVYHINSNDNIHMIPDIFDLVCKLAAEYKIPYVRTLNEELYYVPDFKHIFNIKYLSNISKLLKFNNLSKNNASILKNYPLKTNNYIIGVGMYSLMDSKAVEYGLKTLSDENDIVVECTIQPCSYLRNKNDYHAMEYKMTQDKILEDTVYRLGYEIVSHRNI